MTTRKRILAISGSIKRKSSNIAILELIKQKFIEELEVDIYDQIDQLPHFNPELDNDMPPVSVTQLRHKIQSADGVIFCTPEYVFSLPGSLKNSIEWTVSTTVFSNKPVAIIVAAASGEKAMESLKLIMTTIEARIEEESMLLIRGIKGKFDANGQLNSITSNALMEVVESLMTSIEDENSVPTKYENTDLRSYREKE